MVRKNLFRVRVIFFYRDKFLGENLDGDFSFERILYINFIVKISTV